MKATLKNEKTGSIKQVKVGFSWTQFFWGWLVPIFRADWKWFLIELVITVLANCVTEVAGFGTTGGLVVGIVFAFIYNKLYIKDLIAKGFRPTDGSSRDIISQVDIEVPSDK